MTGIMQIVNIQTQDQSDSPNPFVARTTSKDRSKTLKIGSEGIASNARLLQSSNGLSEPKMKRTVFKDVTVAKPIYSDF